MCIESGRCQSSIRGRDPGGTYRSGHHGEQKRREPKNDSGCNTSAQNVSQKFLRRVFRRVRLAQRPRNKRVQRHDSPATRLHRPKDKVQAGSMRLDLKQVSLNAKRKTRRTRSRALRTPLNERFGSQRKFLSPERRRKRSHGSRPGTIALCRTLSSALSQAQMPCQHP